MAWKLYHKHALDYLGVIPEFLTLHDPRPAVEQFNERYAHGGGWCPFEGFVYDAKARTITYPGDPAYHAVASLNFRDETILVFPHAWVLIAQKDGTFEVSRMD